MADYTITAPDGRTFDITAPDGVSKEEVLMTVAAQPAAAQFNAPSPPPEAPKAETPKAPEKPKPGIAEIVGKNIKKIPERATADVKGAVETFKNPSMAQTLPLATMGPAGPLVGAATRIGTQALGRGMDEPGGLGDKAKAALRGGGLAAAAEAAVPLLARMRIPYAGSVRGAANRLADQRDRVLDRNAERIVQTGRRADVNASRAAEETAERQRGYEFATNAPKDAMDAVLPRTPPNAKVLIPSLGSERISLKEAAAELAKRHGPEYEQTLAEIVDVLNRIDKQKLAGGVGMAAGDLFKSRVSGSRFPVRPVAPKPVMAPTLAQTPPGSAFERAATRAIPAITNPALRTALDYEAGNIPDPVLGAGAVMGAEAVGGLSDVVRHIPRLMK